MKKHSFKAWILATRPWSFPASAMPVLVTIAYLFWLGYDVNLNIGIWTLLAIVIFHAAGNTWSDYHDYIKGVDREDTIGGTSIVSGEFKHQEIRFLAIILMITAISLGIGLVIYTGLPTLYIGLIGAILTMLYPWFKYHALGDVNIFLSYSLLPILGTSFVVTGSFHIETLWLSVPIGLITVGILHINNTRDIESDKRANIKTLAMLIGMKKSILMYCTELIFPFIWVIGGIIFHLFPLWSFIILIALKPATDNVRQALRSHKEGPKALWGIDEMTAKLQLMFSLLMTLALILSKLI